MTDSSGDISLTRSFPHPRERVWEAWTRAEDFSLWFGGPDAEIPLGSLRYHAETGADWSATMLLPEGLRSDWAGRFVEVEAPGVLIMTISDVPESDARDTIEVRLFEESGGTRMDFVQHAVNLPQDLYEVTRDGWDAFFDEMDGLLARER